jgi:peptidoglycan/xylan/chitin deacetylase (PgdA/CDA1 family)
LDQFQGDHNIEIPDQIGRCHERIGQFCQGLIPFRAPGGAWSSRQFTKIANRLPFAHRYVGRYGWDIDACDWRLHRRHGNADKIGFDEYCRRYSEAADRFPSGIILLHDGVPSNESELADPDENKVIKVTEFVIEAMRKRGSRFVPLKEPSGWF